MLINSTDKEKGAQQKDFLVTGIVKDEMVSLLSEQIFKS